MRKRDEPVRLTRIYTRGGDKGQTSLGDGSRVSKLDPRVAALVALFAVFACFTLSDGANFLTSLVSAFASLCFAVITLVAANDVPPSAANSATIAMTTAGLGRRNLRFNMGTSD